uniref:Actin maturation protease n=1 Tax=Amblyomma maculatum TaxID=34609 RepID=G3MSI4_AMBMU
MQKKMRSPTEASEMIPPPPPPPPPPEEQRRQDGAALQRDHDTGVMDNPAVSLVEMQFEKIITGFQDSIAISRVSHLKQVLQKGPQCGLVALSMASQLLQGEPVSVSTLFGMAKSLHFTKKGEMFSVENMKTLAEECLQKCSLEIVSKEHRQAEIVRNLLRGKPVLIPYDSDGNFEPCLKRGRTAHWAVLHGICLVLRPSSLKGGLECLSQLDLQCQKVLHVGNSTPEEAITEFVKLAGSREAVVYVYASQGKE